MKLLNRKKESTNSVEQHLLDNTYCRMLLNNLFEGYQHLAITKSSISFFALAMITNDIIINNRRTVIEFGSGLSTIIMARLVKMNNLPTKIYSVESDVKWFTLLNSILSKENTTEYVTTILAPLEKTGKSKNDLKWYDENAISKQLPKDLLFDLVIIDGPPAHEKDKRLSRYPALPFISNKLNTNYSVYLDDAGRIGETEVLKHWKEEFNISFRMINNRIALASNDEFVQYSCLP